MSHFAKVEDGIVVAVQVADQDWVDAQPDSDKYIQTSYNTWGGKHYDPETGQEDSGTPLRKNYAGIGDTYDSTRDAFYAPQPHPSWTLNETTFQWECPVPSPYTKIPHIWNEDTLSWEEA